MSDKRYPTRMHEICRMEPMIPFEFVCNNIKYTLVIEHEGHVWRLNHAKGKRMLAASVVCELVNHPERIIRRPRLTEEQVKRLRALIALEAMYLAKNKDGSVGAFTSKPQRNALYWNTNDSYVFYINIVGTCLSELVSWEDPEPLDIVQVLRQNGVEVEG